MFELVDEAGKVVNVVDLPDVLLAVEWFFLGFDYMLVSATADEATVICDGQRWLVRRSRPGASQGSRRVSYRATVH